MVFILQTGATASFNTGPPSDHTTQNGYYMYIETSWPRKYGDKAWLVSRNFQGIVPGSSPCKLRFFYHMYGDSAESLNVYIRTFRNGSAQQTVWRKVGSQGAIWNRAVIQLSSNKDFQVFVVFSYQFLTNLPFLQKPGILAGTTEFRPLSLSGSTLKLNKTNSQIDFTISKHPNKANAV